MKAQRRASRGFAVPKDGRLVNSRRITTLGRFRVTRVARSWHHVRLNLEFVLLWRSSEASRGEDPQRNSWVPFGQPAGLI